MGMSCSELVKVLDERSGVNNVITNHPEGDMNVWTKVHDNPSSSCWDIPEWTKVVDQTDRHHRSQSHVISEPKNGLLLLYKALIKN